MIGRIGRICAGLLLAAALLPGARGETLRLPENLVSVEEEAFAGNPAVEYIILPSSVTSVGDRAFAGCSSLGKVRIPGSVSAIGEDILKDTAEDVLIESEAGSPAYDYARSAGLDYRCDTTCRALLVAQTYPDIPGLTLEGPANDAQAFSACLSAFPGTAYQTKIMYNLTAGEILEAISAAFSGAKEQDISLFYYSGHGFSTKDESKRGALLGRDGNTYVTADRLRKALDGIPGRKIVLVDACFSGYFLTDSTEAVRSTSYDAAASGVSGASVINCSADYFMSSFLSAFRKKGRGLAAADYFVLTSASAAELSYEEVVDGQSFGLFTRFLLQGCGHGAESIPADVNGNGSLTLQELYDFVNRTLRYYGQHIQAYPADCRWFGLLRKN